MALVGVGLGLAPTALFAANTSVKTYSLPKAVVHIPHGNFATSKPEVLHIPQANMQLTAETFMRNGIAISEQDLQLYTFKKNNEVLQLCESADGLATSGQIDGWQVTANDNTVHLTNHNFSLTLDLRQQQVLLAKT